jgi:hypothetical protein
MSNSAGTFCITVLIHYAAAAANTQTAAPDINDLFIIITIVNLLSGPLTFIGIYCPPRLLTTSDMAYWTDFARAGSSKRIFIAHTKILTPKIAVLDACALTKDISILPSGDGTLLGEKGCRGGQLKAPSDSLSSRILSMMAMMRS